MPVVKTPAGRIEVSITGDGPVTIILLHAAASAPRALQKLAALLATDRRRIVIPALDGYGETRIEASGNGIDRNIALVAAIANVDAPESCILVGHSMGGLVALRSASHVRNLTAVAVYDPIAFGCLDPECAEDAAALAWDRAIAAELSDRTASGEFETGVATFIEAWNDTPWRDLPQKAQAELIGSATRLATEVRAVSTDRTPASAYAQVRASLLLLHGETSPSAITRIVTRIAAAHPSASIREIPGGGHMAPVLRPEPVAAAIDEFLAAIGG